MEVSTTKERGKGRPPRINGNVADWVTSAQIERVTGTQFDEMNNAITGEAFPPIQETQFRSIPNTGKMVKLVNLRPELPIFQVWAVEFLLKENKFRPDVAIIDTTKKTWRQTGQ